MIAGSVGALDSSESKAGNRIRGRVCFGVAEGHPQSSQPDTQPGGTQPGPVSTNGTVPDESP